jgi:hypothetical protein
MTKILIGGLLTASVLLGAQAYRRYAASEREIGAEADRIRAAGARLDPEGCVTEVLGFARRCHAMATMCQEAVAPLVGTCLRAQDCAGYCQELGPGAADTHFTFARCQARGLKRTDHDCTEAYLAVVGHCRGLVRRTP